MPLSGGTPLPLWSASSSSRLPPFSSVVNTCSRPQENGIPTLVTRQAENDERADHQLQDEISVGTSIASAAFMMCSRPVDQFADRWSRRAERA
jgi:hypothetical protein